MHIRPELEIFDANCTCMSWEMDNRYQIDNNRFRIHSAQLLNKSHNVSLYLAFEYFSRQCNILLNASHRLDKSPSECHLGAVRQRLQPYSHLNCIAVKG